MSLRGSMTKQSRACSILDCHAPLAKTKMFYATIIHMRSIISGNIIPGDGEGRAIGFSTANLDTESEQIPHECGIYAGYITLQGTDQLLPCAVIVRPRNNKKTIEVHILDFDKDIYNTKVIVVIKKMVRPWESFEDIEVLKKQIRNDLFDVKKILKPTLV